MNTAAGFPASFPESHSADVESMKCFIAAVMFPKRVGLPSASPAQRSRSPAVA